MINEEDGEHSLRGLPTLAKSPASLAGDVFSSGIEADPLMNRGHNDSIDVLNMDGSDTRKPLSLLENLYHNDVPSGGSFLGSPWQHRATHTEVDTESEIWIDTDLESEPGE